MMLCYEQSFPHRACARFAVTDYLEDIIPPTRDLVVGPLDGA
jgi:hypothetical protein